LRTPIAVYEKENRRKITMFYGYEPLHAIPSLESVSRVDSRRAISNAFIFILVVLNVIFYGNYLALVFGTSTEVGVFGTNATTIYWLVYISTFELLLLGALSFGTNYVISNQKSTGPLSFYQYGSCLFFLFKIVAIIMVGLATRGFWTSRSSFFVFIDFDQQTLGYPTHINIFLYIGLALLFLPCVGYFVVSSLKKAIRTSAVQPVQRSINEYESLLHRYEQLAAAVLVFYFILITVYIANFLALKFGSGQVYGNGVGSEYFWFLWIDTFRIPLILFGVYVMGRIQMRGESGPLSVLVLFFLVLLALFFSVFTFFIYLEAYRVCDGEVYAVCWARDGGRDEIALAANMMKQAPPLGVTSVATGVFIFALVFKGVFFLLDLALVVLSAVTALAIRERNKRRRALTEPQLVNSYPNPAGQTLGTAVLGYTSSTGLLNVGNAINPTSNTPTIITTGKNGATARNIHFIPENEPLPLQVQSFSSSNVTSLSTLPPPSLSATKFSHRATNAPTPVNAKYSNAPVDYSNFFDRALNTAMSVMGDDKTTNDKFTD
jgi:hypothetical protein